MSGDLVPEKKQMKLTEQLAEQYGIEPNALVATLKKNIIHVGRGEPAPTNEELFHVLTVMNKYQLDPWMKQLHAFRHQGKLCVSVGFDGWVALANRVPGFLGVAYEYPPMTEMVKTKGGKMCWPFVVATCNIQGRAPTTVYAFLDEWYVPGRNSPSNWDKYPTHRLRMKAYTMSVREATGVSLYDEADAEQLRNDRSPLAVATATDMTADALKGALLNEGETPEPVAGPVNADQRGDEVDALFDKLENSDNGSEDSEEK